MLPEYKEFRTLVREGPEPHPMDDVPVYVCIECGNRRSPGDWPQCPHEAGKFGEDPLEPYEDDNLSTDPIHVTTRAQRRAIMNKNHMEYRKKRTDLLPSTRRYFDMGRK